MFFLTLFVLGLAYSFNLTYAEFSLRPSHSFHWNETASERTIYGSTAQLAWMSLTNHPFALGTATGLGLATYTTTPTTQMTPSLSSPATYQVAVGANGKLVFTPNSLNAKVGDIIAFNFHAVNHSLTESTFDMPCQNQGFDSGFEQVGKGSVVLYRVNVSGPKWFFCAQEHPHSHCRAGMVFALNPGGQMDNFIKRARSDSNVTVVRYSYNDESTSTRASKVTNLTGAVTSTLPSETLTSSPPRVTTVTGGTKQLSVGFYGIFGVLTIGLVTVGFFVFMTG